MNRHHCHDQTFHRSAAQVPATGWKADLLHMCGSIGLMAAIIGLRIWWHLHFG